MSGSALVTGGMRAQGFAFEAHARDLTGAKISINGGQHMD
jgi:hypothetical protein